MKVRETFLMIFSSKFCGIIEANNDIPEPSQEFILQKLESGSTRLWHDIQQKMKTFIAENTNMTNFKFEAFLHILKVVNR